MKREIIVNATAPECRIAILENGALAEMLIERKQERGLVGNIYKGKVARVLPGMQAAFVDIGLEKAAFLHVSDISPVPQEVSKILAETEDEILLEERPAAHHASHHVPIERQLSAGQEILVQVAKDPLGMKGARITSHISLPGRYMVYMPTAKHVGVSRRIEDEKERKRLKEIAESLPTDKGGFILRTACEGRSKREILRDFRFLTKLWQRIQQKAAGATAPALIHQDLDLLLRTVRDFVTPETEKVLIDNPKEYRRVLDFVRQFMPRSKSMIVRYDEDEPIMDRFGVEAMIAKALERKVWLRSGGYITIEHTEGLVAIDVNTGRFVGKKNQEETILRTNLEAANEIVRQLRLRNIGGIIIIDFIDMEKASNRKKVYDALREAIKVDKARTKILRISELGVVQMTRQRTRESLEQQLLTACPYCDGKGRIKSRATIAYEILRAIKREKARIQDGKRILLRIHPDIANFLYDEENHSLDMLEKELNQKVIIKASEALHHEKYEISVV
ncbi:MAG TPA: Rne/Rng family ribonuclease [Candidatus Acidoferrales bacterium]|nr:Rne/Rng family ribonuclease [Candidatus Acidoferrales bacterium]